MYKEYLHTPMSKYCSNVVLLLYCIFNGSFIFRTLHRAVFFMSRRNATFLSKVGETGVGEQEISPLPFGECSISLHYGLVVAMDSAKGKKRKGGWS